jgi:hypothetical protein
VCTALYEGGENTAGVFLTSFHGRYAARYGVEAPALGSLGESCDEGVLSLAMLLRRAGTLDVSAIGAAAGAVSYEGPRGVLRLRDRHVRRRIYLARADGLDFDVLTELDLRGARR